MAKAQYIEIYLDILDRMNILPDDVGSDTGATIYNLAAATATDITPSDPAYNAFSVFLAILDAEAETINAYLSVQGHGRKGGSLLGEEADNGFVVVQQISKQGAILPSRIGKIAAVEVAKTIDASPDNTVWQIADPAAMSPVSSYNERSALLNLDELGVFDRVYALNDDETQIWFSGQACRITYTNYQRRAVPVSMEELLTALKEYCPAPEELVSAIKDIAQGALTPREGEMTGAASYLTNRGRSSLTREQIKGAPRPPVISGQKADQ